MTHKTKVVLGLALLALLGVGVWAGFGSSAANKKKLVGTWTLIGGGYGSGGWTLEFSADGKMKATARRGNKTVGYEGSYRVNGDKLEMTTQDDEEGGDSSLRQRVVTITSLSDRELIVADENGRKRAYSRI
jgi:uncharacterized protein (TIGR03066 family)